jgi:hypothetical protein
VYTTEVESQDALCHQVQDAVQVVGGTPGMLEQVQTSLMYHVELDNG